jgi:hypothetical protein
MALEGSPTEETVSVPEAAVEQAPSMNELLVDKAPSFMDPGEMEQRWQMFGEEKTSELANLNSVRASLGMAPTEEPPVYLQHKEGELKMLDDEYVDFEEVKEEPAAEEKQEPANEQAKEKLQSFYGELESLSMGEYRYLAQHGVYVTGELFSSSAFGVLQPAPMKRLVSFYENHQTVDDQAVEEFVETIEPEVVNEAPALEEHKEEPKLLEEHPPEQPALEAHPVESVAIE